MSFPSLNLLVYFQFTFSQGEKNIVKIPKSVSSN